MNIIRKKIVIKHIFTCNVNEYLDSALDTKRKLNGFPLIFSITVRL